jgi:hypothetical protein
VLGRRRVAAEQGFQREVLLGEQLRQVERCVSEVFV